MTTANSGISPSPQVPNGWNETYLHRAIENKDKEALEASTTYLNSESVSPDEKIRYLAQQDEANKTPFQLALEKGHSFAVEALLSLGYDPTITELVKAVSQDKIKIADLTLAFLQERPLSEKVVFFELFELLKQANSDQNKETFARYNALFDRFSKSIKPKPKFLFPLEFGQNLLKKAASAGDLGIVVYLLEKSPPYSAKKSLYPTSEWDTPLERAAASGHLEVVKEILRFLPKNSSDYVSSRSDNVLSSNRKSALKNAIENKHSDVVEFLLSQGLTFSAETFYNCYELGDKDLADILIYSILKLDDQQKFWENLREEIKRKTKLNNYSSRLPENTTNESILEIAESVLQCSFRISNEYPIQMYNTLLSPLLDHEINNSNLNDFMSLLMKFHGLHQVINQQKLDKIAASLFELRPVEISAGDNRSLGMLSEPVYESEREDLLCIQAKLTVNQLSLSNAKTLFSRLGISKVNAPFLKKLAAELLSQLKNSQNLDTMLKLSYMTLNSRITHFSQKLSPKKRLEDLLPKSINGVSTEEFAKKAEELRKSKDNLEKWLNEVKAKLEQTVDEVHEDKT